MKTTRARWGARAALLLGTGAALLWAGPAVRSVSAASWKNPVLPSLSLRGHRYVSTAAMKGFYGFPNAERLRDGVRLRSDWTRLDLREKDRTAVLNGIKVWLSAAPVLHRSTLWVSREDLDTALDPLLRPSHPDLLGSYQHVLIDPGHGGTDPGARASSGIKEKDVVLDVALRLERLLKHRGVRVTLTRRTDKTLSLERRAAQIQAARPDLVVSLHCNAASASAAHGIETFCLTPPGQASTASSKRDSRRYSGNRHDRASVVLAYQVQRALITETGRTDRGVRRARFYVLKNSPAPAILVEMGFLSNSAERGQLASSAYRERLAGAIGAGIQAFRRTLSG